MEFGTCTFEGAPQYGGMGWKLVDHTKTPPELTADLTRSERTQADYLAGVPDWHRQPKEAFRTLARAYGRAERR
ncbi:hypothetical protein OHA21_11035 [Actinoplanes sp. NBC_00393]|uniref:hypothetical protein n=1 Tax=Actinoplanes sp. NBC_00393 TaxID=2975953 RepID=UPI002E22CE68